MKLPNIFDSRKKPINLSYQGIKHYAGIRYANPNLYDISKILSMSENWIKGQIDFEKKSSKTSLSKKDAEYFTSIENLREVMIDTNKDDNIAKIDTLKFISNGFPMMSDLVESIANTFRFLSMDIEQSGNFIYPPNGYMNWHTNHKRPGIRIYTVYSENGDSEFKYSFGDDIKVIKEKKGWNLNIFRVEAPPVKIWHCVNAGSGYRVSYGFRIDDRGM